jgi:hypothetical protein
MNGLLKFPAAAIGASLSLVLCAATSFAVQSTIVNQTLTWNGAARVNPNWTGPLNYSTYTMYRRVEVTYKPSARPVGIQQCVWSGGETCQWHTGIVFTHPGVYYHADVPADWWVKDGGTVNWDVMGTRRLLLRDDVSGDWLENCGGDYCMDDPVAPHIPITLHYHAIVVPPGETFIAPDSWTGCQWNTCYDAPRVSFERPGHLFRTIQGTNPNPYPITVVNGGIGTLALVTTAITYVSGDGWLTTTDPTSGGNEQTIVNTVDVTGLEPGSYEATVTVTASNAVPPSSDYAIQLTVLPGTSVAVRGGAVMPDAWGASFDSHSGRLLVRGPVQSVHHVSVDILNARGELVRSLSGDCSRRAATMSWDRCNESGMKAAPGIYYLRVNSVPRSAGQRFMLKE